MSSLGCPVRRPREPVGCSYTGHSARFWFVTSATRIASTRAQRLLTLPRQQPPDASPAQLVSPLKAKGGTCPSIGKFGETDRTRTQPRFFDHLLASVDLDVVDAGYHHEWRRDRGLSDHSAA